MSARPEIPEGPFLVVGLARSGQAAAKLLASRGHQVIGVDAGQPAGTETLGDFGVDARVGVDGSDALGQVKTVIKSPGVPQDAAVLVGARAAGLTVIGELELGWRMLDHPFIAVTGTNGKTTTTELLGAIYRAAGLPVAVAGNVGTPVCELVGTIDPAATVICEASSFQLEDAPLFDPECAVMLNLSPDHIDRHGSFDAYRDAKLSLFARQTAGHFAVAGASLGLELPGAATKIVAVTGDLEAVPMAMRGAHNLENAAAAAAAARTMGVPEDAIRQALASFKGVEHRMEDVGSFAGVTYINDSKATNVAATVAALASFDSGVHVILGGSLKGERFGELAKPLANSAAAAYLIGESASQLAEDLVDSDVLLKRSGSLEPAVRAAVAAARPGDIVLLAPACASFDQFEDYEDRGRRFKQLVDELAGGVAGQR
ncbi:MAG: UDP-N-acetylmuramoyl-L-alanine--D-glutamate ligase [Solirubrobacterales bacterium]